MKHAMAKPKKSWKERLRIFLLVLCSVVFVVSAGMLVYYLLWEPYQHNQKSVEIQQIYPTRGVEDTTSSEEVNSEGTLSKFDELRALNPDIKGWITLQGEFASEESFLEYVEQVRSRSLIDCPVEVEGSDQILTLSTCSYEQENYRTVVYARRVREGESSTVDIAQAEVNPDPVMPGDN